MPQISSTDAKFNATHDLIYALKYIEPEILLVKIGDVQREALSNLDEIFRKVTPLTVPSSVQAWGVFQEKLQKLNQ